MVGVGEGYRELAMGKKSSHLGESVDFGPNAVRSY